MATLRVVTANQLFSDLKLSVFKFVICVALPTNRPNLIFPAINFTYCI